ncbi:MAG: DUF2145 domain-containing protein [Burkholderiaceae bacterium]
MNNQSITTRPRAIPAAPSLARVRALVARGLFRLGILFAGCTGLAASPGWAGQSCEVHRPGATELRQTFELAAHTATALDRSGADVAILARAGQDLRSYGLRFSHVAFAYRENPGVGGSGLWRVAHLLNECGTARSALYRQGLAEFFNDQPFRWQAALVVPERPVQAALLPLMRDDTRLASLLERRYSMVAYPWAQRYQQSNAWLLETFAMALEPALHERRLAQAWLMVHGYQPTTLRISAARRLGAGLTRANVSFDDHPARQLARNRIETVTADSLLGWLHSAGYGGPMQLID